MSENVKLPILLGPKGLTGSKNLSTVEASYLLKALNVSYFGDVLSKEGGSAKYNATAITGTPAVLGGHDWNPSGGVQRMIVYTDAGELLKDTGAGTFPTTLKTGLNTAALPVFVEGGAEVAANNKKLFVFNNNDVVQVLDGDAATTANLTTPPADWTGANQPSFGVIHENRMWGGGNNNDPHRIYYSTIGDHEDFTGAGSGSIPVYSGRGEKLVAGVSFKGALVLFKYPFGIYYIDTSSATVAEWRVIVINPRVGMAGPLGLTAIDNDILFSDANSSVQLLSAVQSFGEFGNDNLSQKTNMNPFLVDNLNLGQLSKMSVIYYSAKREVHLASPGTGSTYNNRRTVIDLNNPNQPRFRWSDKDTNVSLWQRKDANGILRPVCGDEAGFVWLLDQEVKSKDGDGYSCEFQTAHTDFGYVDPQLENVRKNGQALELTFEPQGDWSLSVDVYWDGDYVQTVSFNMGTTGAGLGDFELDTDKLAGEAVKNNIKRLVGSGRRLSLLFRNSGAGQDFSIAKAYLHCTIGDHKE